ncbi:MAG: DUF6048 family protein [Bacteroidota bacterium]
MGKQLTFRYIFSIFFCWGMLSTTAPAAARSRYWPTGVQLGMEVAHPLYYRYYKQQVDQQREFSASIDSFRLLLEGDYGWGRISKSSALGTQTMDGDEGQYFRVGLGYNFVPATPDRNVAFLGVRYARNLQQGAHRATALFSKHVTASWYEAVAGVKVKVWNIFYVGSTVRYKFNLSMKDETWDPQHLLGWGFCSPGQDETWGFTCYLSIRIPFEYYRVP